MKQQKCEVRGSSHVEKLERSLPDRGTEGTARSFGVLPQHWKVHLHGQGGATLARSRTSGVLAGLPESTKDDILCLILGANDISRRDTSTEEAIDSFKRVTQDCLKLWAGDVVILTLMPRWVKFADWTETPDDYNQKRTEYHAAILPWCEGQDRLYCHRLQGLENPLKYRRDGTHLNELGNKVLVKNIRGLMRFYHRTQKILGPSKRHTGNKKKSLHRK